MGLTGLEPVTFRLSAECSNQLSYKPKPRQIVSPKNWDKTSYSTLAFLPQSKCVDGLKTGLQCSCGMLFEWGQAPGSSQDPRRKSLSGATCRPT
jgi:hypothetical protein